MKVHIDLNACIRAGECYYNHPELLRMGEQGDPELRTSDLATEELKQHARQAAEVCPAGAIIVQEQPGD